MSSKDKGKNTIRSQEGLYLEAEVTSPKEISVWGSSVCCNSNCLFCVSYIIAPHLMFVCVLVFVRTNAFACFKDNGSTIIHGVIIGTWREHDIVTRGGGGGS